jgi:heme exporter protein B
MLLAIISRDLKLAFSNIGQFFNQIIFFFIAVSIFAISFAGSDIDSRLIYQISIIWFCLIFSIIIGISSFLKEDFIDGSLEQVLVNGYSFEMLILGKIIANWLIYCLPLIIFVPLAAIILKIEAIFWQDLVYLSIFVTLIVNLVGCFCAALTVACDKNESLLSILILPLIIPVIIFANSAFIDHAQANLANSLLFLALIFSFLAPILIFLTSFAVRISLQE